MRSMQIASAHLFARKHRKLMRFPMSNCDFELSRDARRRDPGFALKRHRHLARAPLRAHAVALQLWHFSSASTIAQRQPAELLGRLCTHGPALTLTREHETLVALLGDLGALPAVAADALRAEVG